MSEETTSSSLDPSPLKQASKVVVAAVVNGGFLVFYLSGSCHPIEYSFIAFAAWLIPFILAFSSRAVNQIKLLFSILYVVLPFIIRPLYIVQYFLFSINYTLSTVCVHTYKTLRSIEEPDGRIDTYETVSTLGLLSLIGAFVGQFIAILFGYLLPI